MAEQRFDEAISLAVTAVAIKALPNERPHDEALFRDNLKFAAIGFIESLFEAIDEKYSARMNLRDVVNELDLYVRVGERQN